MAKLRKPLLFALCLLPAAMVAGIFVGFYQLDILAEDAIAAFTDQVGSTDILIVISAVQTVGYALFCGFFGYILAEKLGLWRPIRFEKRSLFITLLVSVAGGILLSLDHWVFGGVMEGIQAGNIAGLTVSGILASVLYGGIIEEVMLRLFFLSLVAWVIRKVFCRKCDRENIPPRVFAAANIIAALVFALGHFPVTIAMFGGLTPLLLVRCFLFNGGFGIVFGWLYRRYGIAYAMMSHALCHIVCKLIWLVFI